ncbi:MAG: C40 family peptidase [Clostridia bacterium]|nr:C40 family peptidase [Clostridia bacterium]
MKEKIIIAALASVAAFTLAGCSKVEDEQNELSSSALSEETESGDISVQEEQTESPPTESGSQTEQEGQEDIFPAGEQGSGEESKENTEVQEEVAVAVYIKYVKVTGDNVNIRSGAGTGYSVLGSAEKDTLYACIGEMDGWYKIRYLNSTAYISKKYTSEYEMAASDNSIVESVIEEGAKLLGTEYVYGAVRYHDGKGNLNKNFTVSAFDCSSLTQYIFYKGAGVLLDVTTRTQVAQGVTVARENLQRGDLLFFTNASRKDNTGIERIGHVALYLGDNLILHTSSDYAKIEEMSQQRWDYFIQAQRMV